jgi:surfactin synthase thioesterase subunit
LHAWKDMETAHFNGMSQPVQINEGVKQWMSGLMRLDLAHCQGFGLPNIEEIRAAIEARGGQFSHYQDNPPPAL